MSKLVSFLFLLLILLGCTSGDSSLLPSPPQAPGIISLLLPENNKTCETGTAISESQSEVTFSWGTALNAEWYELTIIDLNTNEPMKIENLVGNSTKVVLKQGAAYSWKLTAKSTKTVQESVSETRNFYLAGIGIKNYAPFPAKIVSPLPGASVKSNGGKINLSWLGSDPENDKLTYTIFFDAKDGKQTPAAELTNISATSISLPVDSGKIYYWRIKSSDGSNSSTTIIYQFKVI